jgi:hypothetical protein
LLELSLSCDRASSKGDRSFRQTHSDAKDVYVSGASLRLSCVATLFHCLRPAPVTASTLAEREKKESSEHGTLVLLPKRAL